MGIETPTPIQEMAIQPILDGRDVIAKAETGTGKTLAFGAPMMSMVTPSRSSVLGLVLCPTRELALQVAEVLRKLGEARGQRVALLVGGDPIHPQITELKAGAQVVVGTPGRILDLHQQSFLTFPWTEFAVLDEADRMFEIGFLDDVKKILALCPDERQTLLFSATYPKEIIKLARDSTRNPVEVATAQGVATTETIEQKYLYTTDAMRSRVLERILKRGGKDDVFLVFCARRTDVDRLLRRLERSRLPISALHGGYDQSVRTQIMADFRAGTYKALIATDVASRGLDVARVTHVINYSVPRELKDYTHRIGRTGRAGRSGIAITFVIPEDRRRWDRIRRESGWDLEELEPPSDDRSRGRRDSSRTRDDARSGSRKRTSSRRDSSSSRRTGESKTSSKPRSKSPSKSSSSKSSSKSSSSKSSSSKSSSSKSSSSKTRSTSRPKSKKKSGKKPPPDKS